MTLVELYHAAHKARLIRMGAPSRYMAPPKPLEPPKTLAPIPNRSIAIACAIAFPPTPCVWNRIELIQRATLREFPTLTIDELKSSRRTKEVVQARQIGMYIAKKNTSASYPEIGRRFGGRDHTTVIHGVRKIEGLIRNDVKLFDQVGRISGWVAESISR